VNGKPFLHLNLACALLRGNANMSYQYPPLFARYELRVIIPDAGPTVCGIYDTLDEAIEAKALKMRSQSYPVIIYDAEEDAPVLPGVKK